MSQAQGQPPGGRWSQGSPVAVTRTVFDKAAVAKNLVVFCVLAAVVTFAVTLTVDAAVVNAIGGTTMSVLEVIGVSAGLGAIGLVFGLLYIPASGTVNERLFRVAGASLIAALTIYRCFTLGIDWGMITVLAWVGCLTAIVWVVPSRVATARREVTEYVGAPLPQQGRAMARPQQAQAQQKPRRDPETRQMRPGDQYGL